jgi:hypothetical protein
MTNLKAFQTIEKHFLTANFGDISFYIIYLFDPKLSENELINDYDFYQSIM